MTLLKLSSIVLQMHIKNPILRLNSPRILFYRDVISFKADTFSNNFNKYIENIEREYKDLMSNNITEKSQQQLFKLEPIIKIIEESRTLENYIKTLTHLSQEKNEDLDHLVKEERILYEKKLNNIRNKLVNKLTQEDTDDCTSVILEINAGVGGQEAMLFASELYDMYSKYIEYKGWNSEIINFNTSELKGLRHAEILVNGNNAYRSLKHEAGVHRVQRIPSTEKSGRIHTSTVSVAVLSHTDEININISEKDLRIDTKRASGAGGQHVNTTDSAVRIVHIPTGLMVECQTERSQIKNKQIALQKLKTKLIQQKSDTRISEMNSTRKMQIGSSLRNEKIRTYNYSQDRITDHRFNSATIYNLKGFLLGNDILDKLIQKLDFEAKKYYLQKLLQSV